MTDHSFDGAYPPRPSPQAAPSGESSEAERLAYLAGLKSQIRQGVYKPDIRDLARSLADMIVRDL